AGLVALLALPPDREPIAPQALDVVADQLARVVVALPPPASAHALDVARRLWEACRELVRVDVLPLVQLPGLAPIAALVERHDDVLDQHVLDARLLEHLVHFDEPVTLLARFLERLATLGQDLVLRAEVLGVPLEIARAPLRVPIGAIRHVAS